MMIESPRHREISRASMDVDGTLLGPRTGPTNDEEVPMPIIARIIPQRVMRGGALAFAVRFG